MHPKNRCLGLCASLLFSVLLVPYLHAQQAPSRYEIGGDFVYMHFHPSGAPDNRVGFGARFTYNFNNLFALDTEWSMTPKNAPLQFPFAGGKTNEFFAGAKIGGRKPRWGAFAKLRPGFIRTEDVPKVLDFMGNTTVIGTGTIGSRTDFLLDAGAVVEFYPAKRWILRYDVSDTIIFYGNGLRLVNLPPIVPVSSFSEPGFSSNTFHFTAGISYRFGK